MKLRNLQGLRAIAALAVVVVHLYNLEATYLVGHVWTKPFHILGGYGIDLFFVISGFIILVTAWDQFGGAVSAGQFLVRRITRIYPPYWVACIMMLAVYLLHPAYINPHSAHRPDIVASFLILPQRGEPLVLVGWTLVYEILFSLVFTIALLFRRSWLPVISVIWIALMIAAAHINSPAGRVLSSPLNLEFVFGMIAGAVFVRRPGAFARAVTVLAIGSTLALAIWTVTLPAEYLELGWWRPFVIGLPMTAAVYGLLQLEAQGRFVFLRSLQRIGDASYSLYLWHVPVLGLVALAIFHLHRHVEIMHPIFIVCGYAASIGAALLLYAWVERPLLRFLRRLGKAYGLRISRSKGRIASAQTR